MKTNGRSPDWISDRKFIRDVSDREVGSRPENDRLGSEILNESKPASENAGCQVRFFFFAFFFYFLFFFIAFIEIKVRLCNLFSLETQRKIRLICLVLSSLVFSTILLKKFDGGR